MHKDDMQKSYTLMRSLCSNLKQLVTKEFYLVVHL